jgi:hypothetical protein
LKKVKQNKRSSGNIITGMGGTMATGISGRRAGKGDMMIEININIFLSRQMANKAKSKIPKG